MGCCYSSEGDSSEQDREEGKPLLIPVANAASKSSGGTDPDYRSIPSRFPDEQALLNTILSKTAHNIIDVSAADSQGMEQHEYMDRARQYSTRLAMISGSTQCKRVTSLPTLTNQPHQVLASEPVPPSDIQQISKIAAYASSALSQIKVDAKEELVVQFAIP
ncbi:ragulator complex protein LAMTOR1 [Hemiscyllium ocellatum]|uniref:ragulator complex protein LAMTOR1 n=1 Tax=Hemiscyllium ocellatum TaxID=170820 RepID=UPI0029673BE0|nr:ragulator complex protein LAMTOR1 [Hemiscyllium ocellatum]